MNRKLATLCYLLVLFVNPQSLLAYEWNGTPYRGRWVQNNINTKPRIIEVTATKTGSLWVSRFHTGKITTLINYKTNTCTIFHSTHKAKAILQFDPKTLRCKLYPEYTNEDHSLVYLMSKPCTGQKNAKISGTGTLTDKAGHKIQRWECTTQEDDTVTQSYRSDIKMVISQKIDYTTTKLLSYKKITANHRLPATPLKFTSVDTAEFAGVINVTVTKTPPQNTTTAQATKTPKAENYQGKPWVGPLYKSIMDDGTINKMSQMINKKPLATLAPTERKMFVFMMKSVKQDFKFTAKGRYITHFMGKELNGSYSVNGLKAKIELSEKTRDSIGASSQKFMVLQFTPDYKSFRFVIDRDPRVFKIYGSK